MYTYLTEVTDVLLGDEKLTNENMEISEFVKFKF